MTLDGSWAADAPATGGILVTGMMSHAMYRLDPFTATFERIVIPVERSNPRAVKLDQRGDWWVLLGAPGKVARYTPARREWKTYDIGMYPHGITVGGDGRVGFNGHFTRHPAQIDVIDVAFGASPARVPSRMARIQMEKRS